MATAQDIAAFRGQFAEFSSVNDPDIAAIMNTVDVLIDGRKWPNQLDFAKARMQLAAHMIILQQQQASNSVGAGTGLGLSDLFVRQIRFGERNVSFQQRKGFTDSANSAPGEAMLGLTTYGQTYEILRARNIPAIAVI